MDLSRGVECSGRDESGAILRSSDDVVVGTVSDESCEKALPGGRYARFFGASVEAGYMALV